VSQTALFANADPDTSRAAAERITSSGRRASLNQKALAHLKTCLRPPTYREAAQAIGEDRHEVMKRLNDLRHDGLVEHASERACSITGHRCVTWRAIAGNLHSNAKGHDRGGDHEPVKAAPATWHCYGAGRRRISTNPDVFGFCDELTGKPCLHAQARRRIHPDPNHDLPGEAHNITAEVRL